MLAMSSHLAMTEATSILVTCALARSGAASGHFEFDIESGAVSFHLIEDFRGRECTSLDIERMLNTVGFPISLW